MTPAGPTEAERREVEAFLFLEARLADTSRYAEWEALVTDDMHYWVPAGQAGGDPAATLSYVNDNRARLATRIRQLASGKRHAQTPVSPMCRTVTNIEILEADPDAGTYLVTASQVVHEFAAQSSARLQLWPGRVTYRLRRVDGSLRMAAKTVELVNATEPQPNLTFLL
jgi:3-phenylpropionate/cinnamic acid dioxygenase small subunit